MSSTTASDVSTFTIYTTSMSAIFTPPASCSSLWTYEPESWNSVSGGIMIQNEDYAEQNSECYPPGYDQWGRAPSFAQVFSPGVCPSGYATAGSFEDGSTTTAICCPSHFGYTQTVSSVNSGNKTGSYFGCTSTYPASAAATTVFAATNGFTSTYDDGLTTEFTAISGDVLMWAQVVTVAYDSAQLALFSPSTAKTSTSAQTSSSTAASTITSTTASAASQVASTTATPSPSIGLSGGAIAGIVIGAIAGIALLVGLAFYLGRRRRQHKSQADQPNAAASPAPMTQQYGHDTGAGVPAGAAMATQERKDPELGSGYMGELDGRNDRRHELGTEERRYELGD